MRRSALLVLGLVMAFGAVAGFAARQNTSPSVEVMRPAAEPGTRTRGLRSAAPTRGGEPVTAQRQDRRDGRQFAGWRAVQLGLDALNAIVGVIGIAMAWRGMWFRAPSPAAAHFAASHTPDRISTSPTA